LIEAGYGGVRVVYKSAYIKCCIFRALDSEELRQIGITTWIDFIKSGSIIDQLVDDTSIALQIPRDDLFHIITGGQILEIRGTYVHRRLIVPIAYWIGSVIGVQVSDFIEKASLSEAEERIANEKKKYKKA
jgi:hypothetical protein